MNRKKPNQNSCKTTFSEFNTLKVTGSEDSKNELDVTLFVGQQRSPFSLTVPKQCNMKILKSMLWFNLKKILTIAEFNRILGFQSVPTNHELDYQLQHGIGQLKSPVNLVCFIKIEKVNQNSLLNYKICKLISVGGFSKVYLLRDYRTGQFLAGKFILKENANVELINNEYQIAASLEHPFIIKTHQLLQTEHFFVIIMEYLPGGELFEMLKYNRHMGEEAARFYILETLLALKYLHEQNIIYRDIKPENIILDENGHIKLTDFGLAKRIRDKSFSFCGSLDYMAPQVLQEAGYSFEIDYYSIGNLLFQILIGSPPFYHPKFTQEQTKYHILNTDIKFTESMKLSPVVISLLTQLLQKQPAKRLGSQGGVDQILQHQWFKDIDLHAYSQKQVSPPIKIKIQMDFPNDESSQQLSQWQAVIQKDLKQQRIKIQYHTRKIKGSRHRSMNSHKSYDQFVHSPGPSRSPLKKCQSKLKSNLSLLYVLTHKRSTSEYPTKNSLKSYLTKNITSSYSTLKSTNLSRKTSFTGLTRGVQIKETPTPSNRNSHTDLNVNLMLICGNKNKENIHFIRKKGKQTRAAVRFMK